jgi:YidC/Oxa1 family membrane protein insertase
MFDFLAPLWNNLIYNPMLNALLFLYSIIPNYGIAIVLFTLFIASLTMPLRIKSQISMRAQQAKTAKLKPRLDELKKKYKDDPQQLQSAQMKLYQEEGLVNPFNSGCLLTLLPFPIFIGLYNVITSVMGTTPEQLLQLSPHLYPFFPQAARLVPVNPNFFGLNLAAKPSEQGIVAMALLVGLVVASSWVQQRMMVMPTASLDPQQAQMNQSMQLMTPLIFGFFVLQAPAGLSLYWITFSVVGIVQQYFTTGWGNLFGQPAPQKNAKPQRLSAPPAASTVSSNGNDNSSEKPAAPVTASSGSKKGKKKSGKKR